MTTRRTLRRGLAAGAIAAVALLAMAAPAGADPAKPTNYRSTVAKVAPPTTFARLRVVGGDGFLDLDVVRGHTVTILGYRDEPYLRVLADGTVQENTNSPATYLNRSRTATSGVPDALLGDTLPAPAWRTSGHGGHAVWHDHRIHFMGSDPASLPGLAEGRPIAWTVKFSVDGRATVASGSYHLVSAPSPAPWFALIVLAAAGVAFAGRRHPIPVAAVATALAGLVGLVIGWEQNAAIPAGAGATPLTIALPALTLLAGCAGWFRRTRPAGAIAVLAGVASLGGWFVSRYTVLLRSVLPTDLPFAADRAGTALAVGAALAAAWLTVRSGALAAPAPAPKPGADPSPSPA